MLTGPVEQQDVEIAALYRDAQVNYGQKNILGILATRHDHVMYKRQAPIETSTTTDIPLPTTEDPPVENLIYAAQGKGLLVIYEAPILKIRGNKSSDDATYELSKHAHVSADERGDVFRLIIKFLVNDKTVKRILPLLKAYLLMESCNFRFTSSLFFKSLAVVIGQ